MRRLSVVPEVGEGCEYVVLSSLVPIIHIADGLSVYDARTHLDRELNHEPLWE